ncbi:glutaredoxin domain-containing protein [Mycolicibacterium goodii]|uniref:glutaredoxin domain-containing protein n=1 Tax=Mycolicibacterium goodii TaxID=134601 RepID=UPI00256F0E2F|nr:glutaredoxin domain-containing protein [Mycolicibacterium goodii]
MTPTETIPDHLDQDGVAAMTITMYTKPGCVQCRATARQFQKCGVTIQTIDVTAHPEAAQLLDDLGYRSLPVVMTTDGQHWSGHRPDRVDLLIRTVQDQMSCPRL